MSDSNMSKGLKEALGMSEGPDSVLGALEGSQQDLSTEFDDYKEPDRDPKDNDLNVVEIETKVPDLNESDAKADYAIARNHTYALLTVTTQAVGRAMAVVRETEHPRAFESFNSLVATARLLTQDLLSLQKVYKDITKGRPEMETVPVVHVNVNGQTTVNPITQKTHEELYKELQDAILSGEIVPITVNRPRPADVSQDIEDKS